MNVLRSLGEILTKDGIKSGFLMREAVLPSMFDHPRPKLVSTKRKGTKIKVPKNQPENPHQLLPKILSDSLPKDSSTSPSKNSSKSPSNNLLKGPPNNLPKNSSKNSPNNGPKSPPTNNLLKSPSKNSSKSPSNNLLKSPPNNLPKSSSKNSLNNGPKSSPKNSSKNSSKNSPNNAPESLPKNLPKNQMVKENIQYVGKGSNLGKKVAKEYLSPLQGNSISRHNILDDYDVEKATRVQAQLKCIEKSPELREVWVTRLLQFTGEMLAALIACSPPKVKVNSQISMKSYWRYSRKELPQIPVFGNDRGVFEDYIGLLTHTDFLHKNSSSTNGIIPKLLRDLMHPANIKTLHLRCTKCYNDMIYYFSEKFDFASCRELFVQMKVENVSPNTVTYNLLLRSVLKNSHIRKTKLPEDEVLYYLKCMKNRGVEADSVTWTTCYNLLRDDVSRQLFVEQMHERSVPFTKDFVYTVLRNGDYSSSECLTFLTNNKIPLDHKSFRLCVARLLSEDRVDVAWVFLEYTVKNSGKELRLGVDVLNQFLRVFAAKGRLDLAFMTFNTYFRDCGIKPDLHTFDMLFKALVRNGYHKNFSVVLIYLQNLRRKYGFENRNNYWLVKGHSMAKFNIDPQLGAVTSSKLQTMDRMVSGLKWGVDTTTYTTRIWESHGTQFKKACRLIGCIPTAFRRPSPIKTNAPQRKAKYRQRIRYVAVQNAMLQRIPYAKDWYGTLKKELVERGLSCK